MTTFLLTSEHPEDKAKGRIYLIDPAEYAEKLRERWTTINITESAGVYCLYWEIGNPNDAGPIGNLRTDGRGITISASRSDLIEFAFWHRTIISEQYPLFLFDEGLHVIIELTANTTREDLEEYLL